MLITKNAMEIDTLISESEKYLSTFTACKFLLNAYKIAKENDYYLDLLSVIKPESRKMLSYGNTSNVVAKLENGKRQIACSHVNLALFYFVILERHQSEMNKTQVAKQRLAAMLTGFMNLTFGDATITRRSLRIHL